MRNSIPDFFELTHGGSAHINSEILGGNQRVVRLGLTKTGKSGRLKSGRGFIKRISRGKARSPGRPNNPPPANKSRNDSPSSKFLFAGREI